MVPLRAECVIECVATLLETIVYHEVAVLIEVFSTNPDAG